MTRASPEESAARANLPREVTLTGNDMRAGFAHQRREGLLEVRDDRAPAAAGCAAAEIASATEAATASSAAGAAGNADQPARREGKRFFFMVGCGGRSDTWLLVRGG